MARVLRLDGPEGFSSPPPLWATTDLLKGAVHSAADSVRVHAPYSPATGERVLKWGEQLDVHPIRSDAFTETSAVTDSAVAAASRNTSPKASAMRGGIDYRIHDFDSIRLAPVNAHLRALMSACWRLGGLPELEALNLRAPTEHCARSARTTRASRRCRS